MMDDDTSMTRDCMEMGGHGVSCGLDGRHLEQHAAGRASNSTPSRGGQDLSRNVLVMIQVWVRHPRYRTITHCLFMGSEFLNLRIIPRYVSGDMATPDLWTASKLSPFLNIP